MDTLDAKVTTRELRGNLADTLGRVSYGHDRIGITRNGKLAAVMIDPADFAKLEALEEADDVRAYLVAKTDDDGTRVDAEALFAELGL